THEQESFPLKRRRQRPSDRAERTALCSRPRFPHRRTGQLGQHTNGVRYRLDGRAEYERYFQQSLRRGETLPLCRLFSTPTGRTRCSAWLACREAPCNSSRRAEAAAETEKTVRSGAGGAEDAPRHAR